MTAAETIKIEHGYWWPTNMLAEPTMPYVRRAQQHVPLIAQHCATRNVVIQAGGHVGLWPLQLSRLFERVITFEPCEANYNSLHLNLSLHRATNVQHFHAALGESEGWATLRQHRTNSGGHWIVDDAKGATDIVPLDKFTECINHVSAILLDVEGHELFALRGAEETIRRHRPLICFEDNRNLRDKGGYEPEVLYDYLRGLSYRPLARVGQDAIWTKGT